MVHHKVYLSIKILHLSIYLRRTRSHSHVQSKTTHDSNRAHTHVRTKQMTADVNAAIHCRSLTVLTELCSLGFGHRHQQAMIWFDEKNLNSNFSFPHANAIYLLWFCQNPNLQVNYLRAINDYGGDDDDDVHLVVSCYYYQQRRYEDGAHSYTHADRSRGECNGK